MRSIESGHSLGAGPPNFELVVVLGPECRVRDTQGVELSLVEIVVPITRTLKHQSVMLTHGRYASAAVATGTGTLDGHPLSVTLTQRQGHGVKGQLTIHHAGTHTVVDMPLR